MKIAHFLVFKSIVSVTTGILLVVISKPLMAFYGVQLDTSGSKGLKFMPNA